MASTYHVGDLWKLTFTVTDPSAVDPTKPVKPSSFAVTVTKPSGATETPSATEASEGVFTASVNLTEARAWHATAVTTGTYQASQPVSIDVLEA